MTINLFSVSFKKNRERNLLRRLRLAELFETMTLGNDNTRAAHDNWLTFTYPSLYFPPLREAEMAIRQDVGSIVILLALIHFVPVLWVLRFVFDDQALSEKVGSRLVARDSPVLVIIFTLPLDFYTYVS